MIELRPEFRFSSQIRPILPGLRPFCLDLANFGRIWTILLGFGPYSLDLGPKGDKAEGGAGGGWTDVRMDGRTDRFPLCSTGLCPLRALGAGAPPQLKSHTTQAGHGYR